MKKLSNVVGVFLIMTLLFSGCSKDDDALVYDFVAAFKEPSADFSQPEE